MASSPGNYSTAPVSEFLLVCFPNYRSWQHWLSLPLSLLFLLAMGANTTLLTTVWLEASLHEPMYCLLSLALPAGHHALPDCHPQGPGHLLFDLRSISFSACFLQMFIMNSFLPMESCTFRVMAYDRYMAICHPLQYPSIITDQFVAKANFFIITRNALLTVPIPILSSQLHYCSDFILIFSYTFILRAVLRFKAEGAAVKDLNACDSHFILILFISTILLVVVLTNMARKRVPMDIFILLNVLHHLIPPALNPIVYEVQIKEIKQGIKKLMGTGM
ncbi:olfactory receptor 56a1-like [Lynx pardinus]|uniref:Olfactory receptor 56a1-like n=1 Tax=Lynx pardinus TaxID=191816 RepID=A0A485N902_LYNPA|nr:olfactory receptor 56a1-like [Lynx pardinus]